jgi:hypothetical protein
MEIQEADKYWWISLEPLEARPWIELGISHVPHGNFSRRPPLCLANGTSYRSFVDQVLRETLSVNPTKNASAVTNESAFSTHTGQQSTINSSGAEFLTVVDFDSLVEAEEYSLTMWVSPRGAAVHVCALSHAGDVPTNFANVCQCRGCGWRWPARMSVA